MDRSEAKRFESANAALDAEEVLHTESGGLIEAEYDWERTYKLSQDELRRDHLDEQTAANIYDLNLERWAPYGQRYDRSGRFGLMWGRRGGHVSVMDCKDRTLKTEFYAEETVRDGTFLHNPTMFALAQKDRVFVYDDKGTEIHRMGDHSHVSRMEFLPYHWLLGEYSFLVLILNNQP